jgi:PAS domain S-box-containing protein
MTNDVEGRYRAIFELAPVSLWEQDFTEAVAAIDAMKAAGVRDFRAHFRAQPELLAELARMVKVIDVNRISPVMFGAASKEELLGSLDKVFVAETYPVFAEQMIALASGEPMFVTEGMARTLQGDVLYCFCSLVMLPPHQGITRGLVTIMDISQRRLAEKELATQEKLYRTLIESIPHMVWMGDAQGRITYCNHAMRQATQRTNTDFVGHDWIEIIHPDDREKILELREAAQRHRRPYRGEFRFHAADGSHRVVYFIGTPVEDEHGEVVQWVGINTDITELKQAQHTLQTSLERSNLELAQIAYAASHDLQEPLRMISSYADLLETRRGDQIDEKTSRYAGYMVEGAARIRQLIDDLVMLSSISKEAREPAQVQTGAVVAAVTAAMQDELDVCGGQIVCGDLPDVLADRRQLMQLFHHLFDNSLKFRRDEAPRIELSVRRDGSMYQFAVKDNGQGFDGKKYGERIFGMFQRLHDRDQYPGTGIGLALAKKIVERNGGRIWVESHPGDGATFFFTMPAVPGEIVDGNAV